MKTYCGLRDDRGAHVYVIENGRQRQLPLRLDLENKSPTGFEWGYWGSGPAQLALALLADALGDDDRALKLYQKFKFARIGKLPRDGQWMISQQEILRFAESDRCDNN